MKDFFLKEEFNFLELFLLLTLSSLYSNDVIGEVLLIVGAILVVFVNNITLKVVKK